MSGFCLHIFGPEARHKPLHLRLSFREGAAYFLEHCSFTSIYLVQTERKIYFENK